MKNGGFFENLGRRTIEFFDAVYEFSRLFIQTVKNIPSAWFYRRQIFEQFYNFLANTLPLASVIAVFIGLGAMIQGQYQSVPFVPRIYSINVIFKSTILVLGPIILSLVLAGKLGASLAAELGSMKISDQVDALETLSLDPVGFLVLPRVLAGVIMLPVITIYANLIALFSMFFASSVLSDWISPFEFIKGIEMNFRPFELYLGNLIKPGVYGFIISLVGSFFGLRTHGGALGVGRSATSAVVVSAILIVFFDYYLGRMLL